VRAHRFARPSSLAALLLFLGVACAGSQTGPPDTARSSGRTDRIPPTRQATQEELAAAFDPDAPLPAAKPKPPTPPQAPVVDEQWAAFDARAAEVRQALGQGDGARAQELASELAKLVPQGGPGAGAQAAELTFLAGRLAQGEPSADLATRWLLSCGPEEVAACRQAALAALAEAQPNKKGKAAEFPRKLKAADDCLSRAEGSARRARELPSCLDDAQREYAQLGDLLMVQRALVLRALHEGRDEKRRAQATSMLTRAEARCTAPRCAKERMAALARLAQWQLADKKLGPALRTALAEVKLNATLLPAPGRLYARTPSLDAVCQALDAEQGPGACRKEERALRAEATFRDFSRERVEGEGMSMEVVREVNAHFGVTLEPCLTAEASRLLPPAMERYHVRWTVLNDGRVGEVTMERRDLNQGPLAQCLREQFKVWRYPQYDGEWQHVEQMFLVSAKRTR
jgi:hypothetical protein